MREYLLGVHFTNFNLVEEEGYAEDFILVRICVDVPEVYSHLDKGGLDLLARCTLLANSEEYLQLFTDFENILMLRNQHLFWCSLLFHLFLRRLPHLLKWKRLL